MITDDKKEQLNQCLLDLVGYIDNGYEIAVHYGVPRDIAAMQGKHMHSIVIRLKRLIDLP